MGARRAATSAKLKTACGLRVLQEPLSCRHDARSIPNPGKTAPRLEFQAPPPPRVGASRCSPRRSVAGSALAASGLDDEALAGGCIDCRSGPAVDGRACGSLAIRNANLAHDVVTPSLTSTAAATANCACNIASPRAATRRAQQGFLEIRGGRGRELQPRATWPVRPADFGPPRVPGLLPRSPTDEVSGSPDSGADELDGSR